MQKLNLRVPLPSCVVDKKLVNQLESFLLVNTPRLLKKELSQMMGLYDLKSPASLITYAINISEKTQIHQLDRVKQFKPDCFDPKTKGLSMKLKIGRPEILDITLLFPANGAPTLTISTVSEGVKPLCPRIADQLISLFAGWKNRNYLVSRPAFRTLIVVIPPALVTTGGLYLGGDSYIITVAQGWLLIISACLAFNLFRLFPQVSFQTRSMINLKKIAALTFFAFNIALILAYTGLLYLNLNLIKWPF
jgi:hypothetical protein